MRGLRGAAFAPPKRYDAMPSPRYPLDLMIRRLGSAARFSEAELHELRHVPTAIRTIEAQRDIIHEGNPSAHCCVVLDGWTCCYQLLSEGRRQILSFHVPGDLPDLQSLYLPASDFGMATVTRASIAFVSHANLRKVADGSAAITHALWRNALVSAATHRTWITSLGRRDARQKFAHLICELYLRLEAAGLASGHSMLMPLRQPDIADALGLTTVHVNRTLKGMRNEGLIDLRTRRLTILDWAALRAVAGFSSRYLHLDD